ncbi:MAG TPA: Arm DNA-binding domain-containing protein, partial [Hymenobacter sp.]
MPKRKHNHNTMTLWLWLKLHKINKAGKAPISLRITINGKRAELSTDIRLFPEEWDQASEKIVATIRPASAVDKDNDYLDDLKADARLAKRSFKKEDQTSQRIATELRGEPSAPAICLMAALEQVLASHYRKANQHTLAGFERAAVLLRIWHQQRSKQKPD